MITLGDISLLKTIEGWRIKKKLDLTLISYLRKNHINTAEKLNQIKDYIITEEFLRAEIDNFLLLAMDTINSWNSTSNEEDKGLNLSRLSLSNTEHTFRGQILPVSYKPAEEIWGNWKTTELHQVIHGATTYQLDGERSYKFYPFTYEFRGVRENHIPRIHQGIRLFYRQLNNLKKIYPELPSDQDIFLYKQIDKIEKIEEFLPDILEYYDSNENFVFGLLTNDDKYEMLSDKQGQLRQGFIKLIANYMTPEETESIHIKTLDKFKMRQ